MPAVSRRVLMVAGLCLGTAAVPALLPAASPADGARLRLGPLLPDRFGEWRTVPADAPVLPDPRDQETVARAYDESVSRAYRDGEGRLFMLVLAHGDSRSGMLAIHRPPTCYTAQGFTVAPRADGQISGRAGPITVQRMLAVRDDRVEPVAYWMSIAGRQTGFGVAQNVAVLRAAARGAAPDGLLIRASMIGSGVASDFAALDRFLLALLEAAPPTLRTRLGA